MTPLIRAFWRGDWLYKYVASNRWMILLIHVFCTGHWHAKRQARKPRIQLTVWNCVLHFVCVCVWGGGGLVINKFIGLEILRRIISSGGIPIFIQHIQCSRSHLWSYKGGVSGRKHFHWVPFYGIRSFHALFHNFQNVSI